MGIISRPPWPTEYPWDYAWLIPVAMTVLKKGAELAGEVCDEVRLVGREHGREMVRDEQLPAMCEAILI